VIDVTSEQGSIEAVHCLTEAPKQKAAHELPCNGVVEAGLLFDERFIVRLRTLDHFNFSSVGLNIYKHEHRSLQKCDLISRTTAIFSTVSTLAFSSFRVDMMGKL
jgi:hypothetical protein